MPNIPAAYKKTKTNLLHEHIVIYTRVPSTFLESYVNLPFILTFPIMC